MPETLKLTYKQRQFIMNFSLPFVDDVQSMARDCMGALPQLAERCGLSYSQLYEFIHADADKVAIGRAITVYAGITAQEVPAQRPGQAIAKPPSTRKPKVYPDGYAEFKSIYPRRSGDPNWDGGARAWSARLAEEHTAKQMIDGARRYAEWCAIEYGGESKYIQQASRFLGPGKPFLLPWTVGPRALNATDRIMAANRFTNETPDQDRVIEHDATIAD
jgi:hypothetical protein